MVVQPPPKQCDCSQQYAPCASMLLTSSPVHSMLLKLASKKQVTIHRKNIEPAIFLHTKLKGTLVELTTRAQPNSRNHKVWSCQACRPITSFKDYSCFVYWRSWFARRSLFLRHNGQLLRPWTFLGNFDDAYSVSEAGALTPSSHHHNQCIGLHNLRHSISIFKFTVPIRRTVAHERVNT